MNLITKSAKKTRPIAFAGTPKNHAIKAVTIEAIVLHVSALTRLRFGESVLTIFSPNNLRSD